MLGKNFFELIDSLLIRFKKSYHKPTEITPQSPSLPKSKTHFPTIISQLPRINQGCPKDRVFIRNFTVFSRKIIFFPDRYLLWRFQFHLIATYSTQLVSRPAPGNQRRLRPTVHRGHPLDGASWQNELPCAPENTVKVREFKTLEECGTFATVPSMTRGLSKTLVYSVGHI